MTAKIQDTFFTIKIIFQERVIRYAFILLLPLIILLLYSIPVISIPGNDLAFQLQLFTSLDFVLLFIVAALESLLLVMMFYMLRQRQLSGVGQGNLGLLSGIPAFLFGQISALCVLPHYLEYLAQGLWLLQFNTDFGLFPYQSVFCSFRFIPHQKEFRAYVRIVNRCKELSQ